MKSSIASKSPTRRLTILYICALSSVALLSLLGQVIIQFTLQQQSSDANVINIAGRQRMLSQKISKDAVALDLFTDIQTRQARTTELSQATTLWQTTQQGLQQGSTPLGLPGHNSAAITRLFTSIQPNYLAMLNASNNILSLMNSIGSAPLTTKQHTALNTQVLIIMDQESGFLTGMNTIVTQYQLEAEGHVSTLRFLEYTLFVVLLIILLLEGTLIFRPATRRLRKTINDITELEHSIAKQKQELETGIEQILQVHVQTANGNFNVRAPMSQDHVLWQIAHSLNNLLLRLQRLSLVESELQQTKLEAQHRIDLIQNQTVQIKNELQQIHRETSYLVEILREAKLKEQPVPALPSRTLLYPLYRELIGTYVRPTLTSGKG